MIVQSNYVGFGFTTLNLKPLYAYQLLSCTLYAHVHHIAVRNGKTSRFTRYSHGTKLENVDMKSIFYNLGGLAKCKIFSGQQRERELTLKSCSFYRKVNQIH